ncbi:MAG: [protein-PII] uridylyltransferase [Desulfobacterales bacterium CG2_30_60_27]|nr:MAG: [protein-PII] uridylyltransferase [Desulfobacterales bacterium CG2_30_60_27]
MSGELRAGRESLENLWREGLSGQTLLDRHTRLVDDCLAKCFATTRAAGEEMALVALGGYGRRELYPYSDIDLMLLYEAVDEERLNRVTEGVFYPLWDAGLEVGHAVRTLDDSMTAAGQDFFSQVALLDARLIVGSSRLFNNLQEKFRQQYVTGRRLEFYLELQSHRERRLNQFGRHAYLLEPHIKESLGGLRDIQAMLWTAQVVFGLHNLADMEEAGLLSRQERKDFQAAWNELIRIRNRLHYITGRKNDQLYFEYQEEMAKAFAYRTEGGQLGVERFMGVVHGHMQRVAMTTALFFEHVDEVLGPARSVDLDRQLEPGIEVREGYLHFTGLDLVAAKPHLLMRVFYHMARTGLPIHHRTRKAVTDHLHLIDDRLRQSRRLAKAFLEILAEAREPQAVLVAMLETGLLVAYLPEFGRVYSLAQHDVYHVYTVDRHLLQAVVELHALRREEPARFAALAAPRLLFLATLLHDVGKGQGRDHAEHGAMIAATIGKRLGLAAPAVETLAFLVRHHLFLSNTAMRRDLEDQALLRRCVQLVGDADRLNMLYLLTRADAKATGPTVWNAWKAALLLDLYLKIANLLERSSDLADDPDREQGVAWLRQRLREIIGPASEESIAALPDEYLLSFTPETVAHHLACREGLQGRFALMETEPRNGYWSLLIMAPDRTGLLARICGTLALHNLNVLHARIFTWADGTAVDVLDVQPLGEMAFADQDWQALDRDINLVLGNQLGLDHRLGEKRFPLLATRKMGQRPASRVVIDNQISAAFTVIEVYADDRPKLLYDITKTLADFNLGIAWAKIGTRMDQLVDVFYVQDAAGRKIADAGLRKEITNALLHAAGQGV